MCVLTGCGMRILVHACCVDSSVAFSLCAQLMHTMQNNVALSWCYFFAEGVENHFTYKIKCTVNQWTKLKIFVGGGGGGGTTRL